MVEIATADLSDPRVVDLIAFHQREMLAASPPGTSFALDLSGLTDPAIVVLAAWDGERCVAIGALKKLGADWGELKSMRTRPDCVRRGIATRMLDALITLARQRKMVRLSLETGSGNAFAPALALYSKRGFVNGPAFADYRPTEFNQCLHLDLE